MQDWIQVVIRSLSLLIFIFIVAKILGKRQLSELSVFEYLIGIVLAVVAAELSLGLHVPLGLGLISFTIWFLVPFFLSLLAIKSKPLRELLYGKATVLIKDGKILEDNLKKEKYTSEDLLQKLRNKNFFQAADVEFAVLEADGDISILPKRENQPLTPKDFGATVAPIKESQTVIMDGKIQYEPLSTAGLNRNWLETELDKQGVSIENVYLAQVDGYGQLTLDLFDDKIQVPSPQEKPLLLATMKKCQADMELFALSTQNKQAKAMYVKNSKKLQTTIEKLDPLLRN